MKVIQVLCTISLFFFTCAFDHGPQNNVLTLCGFQGQIKVKIQIAQIFVK